ncbi:Cdc6/Cdc18 family protein [Haloarcula amylovorans]|uniref:Cdc6/Cdc18 family protein n=1 Tax=Haloarcula amylovorans TaxID=2562280 RepID=UPI00107654CB|nr:Cdc6/Cdc18 family protein [Halomicroarcula amylolytica]
MISEEQVLDEEAVPTRDLVVHRRDELDRLLEALRPTGTGPADLCYLLGPTGTGKTMVAKLAADLFANAEGMPAADFAHINCWHHYERKDILYQAVEQLRDVPIHHNATGRSQLIAHLGEPVDRPQFVVLDEADQLDDKRVLYDLRESSVNVVLVANNEEDLFRNIDERLQSRLSVGPRIECLAYTAQQLTGILEKRAEWVLGSPGRNYETQHLEFIGTNADGDARVAIRTLATAIDEWRSSDASAITRSHIETALPAAREELRQKSIDQLNDHQRAVYDVVVEHGPITTNNCHVCYGDRVEDPRTQRTVRTYLTKLEQYNLIESEGPGNCPKFVGKSIGN